MPTYLRIRVHTLVVARLIAPYHHGRDAAKMGNWGWVRAMFPARVEGEYDMRILLLMAPPIELQMGQNGAASFSCSFWSCLKREPRFCLPIAN